MQNRRQFIGATALAALPAALALEQGVSWAQTAATDDTASRILRQIAVENARAFNEAKRMGPRGEHFRTAAANLRLFAALDLDADARRAIRQQGRAHGSDPAALRRHLDPPRMQRELRRAGMTVSTADIERALLQFEPTQKTIDLATAPDFSLSGHLRTLAALLEKDSVLASRLEAGPIQRVAQLVDCQKYAFELNLVSYMVAIFCMSGTAPACAAALTSLLLIQAAMYAAGC